MSSTSVSITPLPAAPPTPEQLASLADNSGAPSYLAGRIVVALKTESGRIVPMCSIYGSEFVSFPPVDLAKLGNDPVGVAAIDVRNSWPCTVDKNGAKVFHRPSFHSAASVSLPPGCSVVPAKGSFMSRILAIAKAKK